MGKLRSNLYKTARILGDIEAISKGRAGRRIQRRIGGKMTGRALRSSGCFIATACFGSPLADEVKTLCWFRDRYLLRNILGQLFVEFYYELSPGLGDLIARQEFFRKIVIFILNPIIQLLTFCRRYT